MKINFSILSILLTLLVFSPLTSSQSFHPQLAWDEFQNVLKQDYAYLNDDINTEKLFAEYKKQALKAKNKHEFIDTVQTFVRYFSDPHLNLGPYDKDDFSVSPTGSDIWADYLNSRFIIQDVKAFAAADIAGIKPGDEIVSINNEPVQIAVESVFNKKLKRLTQKQIVHGLNVSLGGKRHQVRQIQIKRAAEIKEYQLPASYQHINLLAAGPTLTYNAVGEIGYIRFNNALGAHESVVEFKKAITELQETKALIIDLRNTPSGGNTSVAEPILGHFVSKKTAYQKYQVQENNISYQDAKMQTAFVEPTKPGYFNPFVILAGRWTGSMGEGMTIGFDALGAKTVIGAPMADLLGGIKTQKLSKSDAWLELGFERLFHVDGSFRENFVPHVNISPADKGKDGSDPALSLAIKYINEKVL